MSCKEYLACKCLLLTNGERYKPLWIHLENGNVKGKKPYPLTVKWMKTLMVNYRAWRVTLPEATKKTNNNHKSQEWVKDVTCFGCGKNEYVVGKCHSTMEEEM